MSFFDPGNLFGGGGPGRDPLGIFSRGGGPMSQQQLMMQRTMGPQRFNTEGPAFGGAGRGFAERDPVEMAAPQPGGSWGAINALGGAQFGGMAGGKPAPMQGGPNPAAMMQGNLSIAGRKGTGMADPTRYAALANAMGRRRGP